MPSQQLLSSLKLHMIRGSVKTAPAIIDLIRIHKADIRLVSGVSSIKIDMLNSLELLPDDSFTYVCKQVVELHSGHVIYVIKRSL